MEQSCDGGQCHGREDFDAQISMRDLVDSYLYPFQQCVEKGARTNSALRVALQLR